MAAFDLQEQEQIAEFKAWWAQWGKLLIAAVAAVVIGYFGRYGWNAYQKSQADEAAAAYAKVETAFKAKDAAKTRAAADEMAKDRSGHALTARAMLLAAKLAFDGNDLAGARSALEWVIANAKEDEVADIASLRLSAVLLDQKQFDAALKAIETPKQEAFKATFADARGDVLAEKGDKTGARKAYQDAVAKLEKDAPARQMIEVKLSALGA